MSSLKLIALSSLQVLLNFMICPISKIRSTTAHSPSGLDVGTWYAPCFWFLWSNQSVQHTTCCTWMGCSVYVGNLLGFNNPGISLSVWMFLLTVSCFILFYPKHLFYQFLVYGHKPLLYPLTICQWPTTAHSPSGPAVQAQNVPHIWFLFSSHPTYSLPSLHDI